LLLSLRCFCVCPGLRLQTTNERGIVISAGGRYYLPQAIVLLRILRHKHRSKLPVEIFWHGDDEMDNTTLAVRGAAAMYCVYDCICCLLFADCCSGV
jgi:hypothetical protein